MQTTIPPLKSSLSFILNNFPREVKVKAAICLHKQCITKYTLVKLDIDKINGFPQPLPVCLVHC